LEAGKNDAGEERVADSQNSKPAMTSSEAIRRRPSRAYHSFTLSRQKIRRLQGLVCSKLHIAKLWRLKGQTSQRSTAWR